MREQRAFHSRSTVRTEWITTATHSDPTVDPSLGEYPRGESLDANAQRS